MLYATRASKSMLYRESTLITWKLTMKDLGPILIISSISPCTWWHELLKALMIMVLGRIRDISTIRCLRVAIRQIFKVDPLSINTLTTIISSHLTTIQWPRYDLFLLEVTHNLKLRLGWWPTPMIPYPRRRNL